MFSLLRPAFCLLGMFTLLTGVVYPAVVTVVAQTAFPYQANGSLLRDNNHNGEIVGSALIGQPFDDAGYFWSRPSATAPYPYNAAASTGSNLGPTNPKLIDRVKAYAAHLRAADPQHRSGVPVDLVTSSGSGLDPHISIAAAYYQIPRVARARKIEEATLKKLVDDVTTRRTIGLLGEPHIPVLKLNLKLDQR